MTASFPVNSLPYFSDIDPAKIEAEIVKQLEKNKQSMETLLAQSGPRTWDNLLQPIEDMQDDLNQMWSPISHLNSVMSTDALRDAYNKVLPALTTYQTEISQNETLFHAIEEIAHASEFEKLSTAQRKIVENDLRDFKLSGIHLPADKKKRLADLEQMLSELTTNFSENLLDATNAWTMHFENADRLQGLPEQALQLASDNAKRRNLTGYVLTLEYPSYSTAIKFLIDRELRHTIYEAYVTRASDRGPNAGKWDNSDVMDKILSIRHEIALLVGYDNFAAYSLATKMAQSTDEVLKFLTDLLKKSKFIADKEYQDLVQIAQKLDGITELHSWDLAYYSEKLQEQTFEFTQEDCRPYFPAPHVMQGLFTIVNKLYGVSIREEKNVDVWHPHVKFFSIWDPNNILRGGFYIDLYARPHKRDGAWMDECKVRRYRHGELQVPVAYLTCNFMPPADNQPALLTHDDVITIFHEFGHCLHHLLTKVDYSSVSGINGVPWDAVEFPSQFMENYCWEKASLDLLASHYQTHQPLPDELYRKMLAAKHFQTGLQMVRQLEFSLFDFRLHLSYDLQNPPKVQAVLNDVRRLTAVAAIPEFNRFQHSFAHIFAGGYAAGYYSYKWAEVLAADAYEAFEENGIFDTATGRSFMENILEVGGVRDPMASFVAFRGREPHVDALLRQSGIA